MDPSRFLPPPAAANPIPPDPTEAARRLMLATGQPAADLEAAEISWDTAEATRLFEFTAFMAPFVGVIRRSDGVRGTLEFTHSPRRYFNFMAADAS